VTEPLEHDVLLGLIADRAQALRTAAAAAPDLGATVPTCPDWTLHDLVQHVGTSHRRWATTVAAGPADAPPELPPVTAPQELHELLVWSSASTAMLLDALATAGPDRGCWTWWDRSTSPQTSGAVARHQVQHVTVHAYDAQLTAGAPEPLPTQAALDGVEEFLSTSCAGTYAWPHAPASVDYRTREGRGWRLALGPERVTSTRLTGDEAEPAGTGLLATASETVLFLYGRVPASALEVTGDAGLFDLLFAWDPDA